MAGYGFGSGEWAEKAGSIRCDPVMKASENGCIKDGSDYTLSANSI
jgi:hypothetical protein